MLIIIPFGILVVRCLGQPIFHIIIIYYGHDAIETILLIQFFFMVNGKQIIIFYNVQVL